jgi:hypothetical protein
MPHLAVPFPAGHASGSGRLRCRLSSRPLPQCPRAHAAIVGVHGAGRLRGCRCPQAASAVAHLDRRSPPAAPTWPGTQGRPRNRTPRQCPPCVRDCGQVLPDGRSPPRTRPQPPEQGRGYGGRRQPTVHAAPTSYGSGRQPPHTVSTAAAEPRRGRLSRRGCPPHGVLPQPADTVAVSAVRPALRPPGDAVRTAGVHRGHRGPAGGVRAAAELDAAQCPLSAAVSGTAAGVRTASVHRGHCGQPGLREAVAGQVGTGWVPPPPVGAGELTLQPVAELGAHVRHGRTLQSQRLLGGQPAQP